MESLLICSPPQKAWKPNIAGHCGNEILAFVWIEAAGLILDLVIVCVPLVALNRLMMKFVEKLPILAFFAISLLYVIHHVFVRTS